MFTFAKFRVTFSINRSSVPEPPVVMFVMHTVSILTLMYSTGFPPHLRTVSNASLKCFPLQQLSIRLGELLSTYLVKLRCCTLTLPLPAPPPTWAVPLFDIPHDQARTSISLVCTLSFDSPLTLSSFKTISTAISLPFYLVGCGPMFGLF